MSQLPPDMIIPFDKPLFRGMKGDDVKALQRNLNTMNDWYEFYQGTKGLPDVVYETGIFDDATIRLLKEFQKFCNLPPSGLYDFNTHDMLQWKHWNCKDAMAKITARNQQEAARIKEAEKKARTMARIGKLFKDGKFGN